MATRKNRISIMIMLWLLSATTVSFAQKKPQLEIQFGHYNRITAISTSKFGGFVLSGDMDGSIRIWDSKSGRIFKTNTNNGGLIKDIVVHPTYFIYTTLQKNNVTTRSFRGSIKTKYQFENTVNSVDVGTDSLMCIATRKGLFINGVFEDSTFYEFRQTASNKRAYFLNDSTIIYSAGDSLFTWDYRSNMVSELEILNSQRIEKETPHLSINRARNRIQLRYKHAVQVFDARFKLVGEYTISNVGPQYIRRSEILDSNRLMMIIASPDINRPIIYELNTGQYHNLDLKTFSDNFWVPVCAWNKKFPDVVFCTTTGRKIEQLTIDSCISKQVYDGLEMNRKIQEFDYSNRTNRLYMNASMGVIELDLNNGISVNNYRGTLYKVLNYKGHDYLFTLEQFNPEKIKLVKLGEDNQEFDYPFTVPKKVRIKEIEYFEKHDLFMLRTDEGEFFSFSFNEKKKRFDHVKRIFRIDKSEGVDDLYSDQKLITSLYNDSTKTFNYFLRDSDAKKKKPILIHDKFASLVVFTPDGNSCLFFASDSIICKDISMKEPTVLWSKDLKTSSSRTYNCFDYNSIGHIVVGTMQGFVYVLDWRSGELLLKGQRIHEDNIVDIRFVKNDTTIMSGSHDGRILLSTLGEEINQVVAIVPFDEKEKIGGVYKRTMLFYTEDNYYFAPNISQKAFHYALNYDVYSFDQFDAIYNRPDIIMERMNGESFVSKLYNRAYRERLEKLNITSTELIDYKSIPKLSIKGLKYLPSTTPEKEISLRFKIESDIVIETIHIWVNGVPYGRGSFNLEKLYAKTIEEKNLDMKSFSLNKLIELSPGKNIVQISATAQNGISSLIETYEITYEGPSKKPDLYFLGIGVKNYQDERRNLEYSDKDVREALNAIVEVGDYANVYIDTLLNENATKEGLIPFRDRIENAQVDDIVIIYYSGHGILDENLDYYLSTHDVDFHDPVKRGLPYGYFEHLMLNTPARNKLVLLDACHSGELSDGVMVKKIKEDGKIESDAKSTILDMVIEKDEALAFEMMKTLFVDIRRDNGSIVLASSGGAYFSFEDDEFSNGVFTYALKEGLLESKADLNRDDEITVSELKDYLISRVSELTKGEQVPNSRIENALIDFRLK